MCNAFLCCGSLGIMRKNSLSGNSSSSSEEGSRPTKGVTFAPDFTRMVCFPDMHQNEYTLILFA